MKKIKEIGEFGIIDIIRRTAFQRKDVIKSIGDDTAVLPKDKKSFILLTTDMLAEGVHFTRSMGAQAIGYKTLACSISDIAAMGGIPTYVVISLGIPENLDIRFVKGIYQGLNKAARKFNVGIVGGDTIRTVKITLNAALLGEVKKSHLVTRSGAKKRDMIFVTGPLGRTLQSGKHLNFVPRVNEAQFLVRNFKPTAMIDISDGLAADLGHILEKSGVGAELVSSRIPRNRRATLRQALSDGEDFELLFTVSPQNARLLLKKRNFFCIGKIVDKKEGLRLIDSKEESKRIHLRGFRHF